MRLPLYLCAALAAALPSGVPASPVINEIMFHPVSGTGAPEVTGREWIELLNASAAPVDLSGWALDKGVDFRFPAGTTIAPGGYLVVTADFVEFSAAYPDHPGPLTGPWSGRLGNAGETIRLVNAAGQSVSEVTYADEGDWAVRARGPISFSHRGWIWVNDADGGGRTLERRSAALSASSGQNWMVSAVVGGTPGAGNPAASADIAPLILAAKHRPEVPRSTEPITVSCVLEDEVAGATATLHWRLDAGTWQALPMSDTDGDGDVEATIPTQANLAVIEWYLEATDGTNTRTWPAPARTSDIGVMPENFAQMTNALVQVDDSFNPATDFTVTANQPIYRLVMTAAERAELAQIGSTNGRQESAARMNATFLSHDGTGVRVRYRCGVRNRGMGSALGPPNNYHVAFPSTDLWAGRAALGLNCRFGYSQVLGTELMARAGIATQEAAIVRVRVNGADLAETTFRMFGRYARIEGRDAAWAEHHYPHDPDGNFYRLDDHAPGATGIPPGNLGNGEFRYEGTNPGAYSDTYVKETNKDADDYSDIIAFCRTVSAPATGGSAAQPAIADANYPTAVSAVLDLDQFYRYIAADALIGNSEGGFATGRMDDASLYRGVVDPRFRLVPHDLDTVFEIGDTAGGTTRNIFSYDGGTSPGTGILGMARLFNHPQLAPRYYAALLEALNSWFQRATVDPIVDQLMAGWVPATDGIPAVPNRGIAEIKAFVDARRSNVLGQIQQNYSLTVTTGATNTAEGYKQTTDGAATFSGTFHVAKTYSVTVNGRLAQWYYRPSGTNAAGTWRLAVTAGGGGVLAPGLNKVVVKFWDGINGTGVALQTLTADVLYSAASAPFAGTLALPGSLSLTAPAGYVPGVPVLVRVDMKDAQGNFDRAAWDRTAVLSASGGLTLTPASVTLYNGVGSALVTIATGSSATQQLIQPGGMASAPNASAPLWRMLDTGAEPAADWKSDPAFNASAWRLDYLHAGGGDGDERTVLSNVNTATGTRRAFYFRQTFDVADPATFTQLELKAIVDDGAIFYLNGVEVYRDNMPAGAVTITTPANTNRAGTAENLVRTFDISAFRSLLQPGVNLLAVEVHNYSVASPVMNSVDLSLECELVATLPATNPGDFTLTAAIPGNPSVSRPIASLAGEVPVNVAGTLPAGTTTWGGVVRVTADVTVPAGATLEILPGTHVLMAGTATAGDTAGAKITVNGALRAAGTAAQPISITAADAGSRWGQITFTNAEPTALSHVFISHAGHSAGVGHTGRGPMLRVTGSAVTMDDSVLADGPAKAIYSSGTCDFIIRRSLIERMITGPELGNGASLLIEDSNIQRILPDYRESNAPAPDDEDCLYVHNGASRPVTIRRSVFARCGDDVFDCLDGPITVEDSILREGWDKGISLLNNDLTISRTLIIDCDKAIVPKSNAAVTRTIQIDRCTIVSEDHNTTLGPWGYAINPSTPDADSPSTGLYTQNKSGQSHAGATLAISARNSIIAAKEPVLVDAPYDAANTVVTFSDTRDLDSAGAPPWPGEGNIAADPRFVLMKDFRLQSSSPARDAGDPGEIDPDGTRADMGALPFHTTASTAGTVTWTAAGGPYRIASDLIVPAGLTLVIQPGASVYFEPNTRLTVDGGALQVLGTKDAHVVFSHVPGTVAAGDCDPIKNGVQTGPPKWGGVRVQDNFATESVVRYADFINAQGTDPVTSENWGSLGFIRSWGRAENVTFSGTHLRMLYGRNCKLSVLHCDFPDMFRFDAALGREENPTDFLASADDRQEALKIEFPTTDTEVSGNAFFTAGMPQDGWLRVYFNDFRGSRGRSDAFDAGSGRWGMPGQFLLDCRFNHFHGLVGDDHIDLRGDAYLAGNVFERGSKDFWTSDTTHASAVAVGDRGAGTTLLASRNFFFDLDHAIDCRRQTSVIFEHNTVANLHADYSFQGTTGAQDVKCAPINFFVPEDGAEPGEGAYLGFNLVSSAPRLFSGADSRQASGSVVNDVMTRLQFNANLLDQIANEEIGANHPGGVFGGTFGPNAAGAPDFEDPAAKDFTLKPASAARGAAPGGFDYGATVPEWAYIAGGPGTQTASPNAAFVIGGPGLVACKWRLDGGAWSAPILIGAGGVFPRDTAVVRQVVLSFSGLASGSHTLEVLGQDMAGNWQDADPARDDEGLPQAAPTTRTWTVNPALPLVRLSEIRAAATAAPDAVELQNTGSAPITLTGWSLTDNPASPFKHSLAALQIAAGDHVTATFAGLNLEKDGDAVFLYQNGVLRDSVTFGHQVADFTIGRIGRDGAWALCQPTLGAENVAQRLGDPAVIRINEWLARGDVVYDEDWIELANPGTLPVALAGLRLTDNLAGNSAGHAIAPLSFIAAGGFVKFIADGKPEKGATHLGFTLDDQQSEIALLNSGTLLDRVAFQPQTSDFSMGRDADGALVFYELPTAALANGSGDPAFANALAILRGVRVTELMYNPAGSGDSEFLELTNIGAVPLALAGVRVSNAVDFTFPAMTLGAGASTVLVSNLAAFRQRYGAAPHVAGQYSGKLDNVGEKLVLHLPPPFDGNVLAFTYSDAWQRVTDGLGKSLVFVNPLLRPGQWGEHESWTASSSVHGNPAGVAIAAPDHWPAWLSLFDLSDADDDGDRDGLATLLEYALATDPAAGDGPASLPEATLTADGQLELRFHLPENPAAVQGMGVVNAAYAVEASDDLIDWVVISTKSFDTAWSGPAAVILGTAVGGLIPVSVRDLSTDAPTRYLRLRATLVP